MQHLGRHANKYHQYMMQQIKKIDAVAKGDQQVFLKLFEQVKNNIMKTPEMLYKDYWKQLGK